MSAETRTRRFSERTIRQVRLDCNRAMIRARFCPDRSDVIQLRCIDDRPESDQCFGNQLWYFEGLGVDENDHRHSVFGVVEYSLQYGLHELVEDGECRDLPTPGPLTICVGTKNQRTFVPTGDWVLEFAAGDNYHPIDDVANLSFLASETDIVRCAERDFAQLKHRGICSCRSAELRD